MKYKKRNSKILSLLTLLFLISGLSAKATPEWLEEVLLFGDTPLPGQFHDSPAVHVWGKTIEYPEKKADLARSAQIVHDEGDYYVGTISTFSPEPEAYVEVPEIMSARVIDIRGEYSQIKWKTSDAEPVYFFNTNLPVYQNYIKQQMHDLIDAGADAILIDEIEGTAGTIQRGGSFGDEDMAMFNQYLLERYTPQELQDWFGIDINTFNYGDWIRDRGLAQVWENKPWNVTLYNDYRFFQRERIKEVMTDLITDARQYAQTQYSKEIAFSANIFGFHPHQMLFSDLLDYFTVEYGYRADLFAPDGHATPFLRYGNERGKPSILLPSVYTGNLVHSWNTADIMRLWTFEAYATGNAFMNSRGFFAGKDTVTGEFLELLPNEEERKETFHFVEDNGYLFSQNAFADVALLYSFATDHINWTREEWAGSAYALLDSHIQYDLISMGAEPWLEDTFTAESLDGYSAVVLAAAKNMSESQINILQDYVSEGGTLLVVGEDAGGFNLQNQRFEFPDWEAMTALGTRNYGAGKVIVLPNSWGLDYFNSRDWSMLDEFAAPLREAADPVTRTYAPSTLHLLTTTANGKHGVDEGFFIHALNYNFNIDTQLIWPTEAFHLQCTIPDNLANQELHVYRYEPGMDPKRVSFIHSGNQIVIQAEAVDVYAAYAVLPTDEARGIADIAIANLNDELTRSTAATANANEVVAWKKEISLQYAEDHYIEAQQGAINLIKRIEELSRKVILHTERNGEISSIEYDRAALIFPSRPEKGYLGELQSRLSDDYVFKTDLDNWLSEQDLSQYDVVMISSPWSHFQPAEKDALKAFIYNGGGVLMLGNPFRNGALNTLVSDFGVQVHEEALSIEEGQNFGLMTLTIDESAPPEIAGASMITNWPTRLTVGGISQVIASSGPNGWLDEVTVNQVLDPGESQGDFPMGAIATYGSGKLMVVADSAFDDAILRVHRNDVFMRKVLNWLTKQEPELSDVKLTLSEPVHGKIIASPAQESYRRESKVTLTAVADPGYAFEGWTGDLSGISNPITLTLLESKTISATFREATVPSIIVPPANVTILAGQSASLSVQASNATSYVWYAGEKGDTSSPLLDSSGTNISVSPDKTTRYWVRAFSPDLAYQDSAAATVTVNYSITASASPGGSINLDPFMQQYAAGTEVTVTATPNSNLIFAGWSGDASGTTNPLVLTLSENTTLHANFANPGSPVFDSPPDDRLIVKTETATLSANVSNAVALQWYKGDSGDTSQPIEGATGTSVQVAPDVTSNYWLQAKSATGEMADSASATVTVVYVLNASTSTGGAIQISPIQSTYQYGDEITIHAYPSSSYSFDGWSGSFSGSANPLVITVTDNLQVRANFGRMASLVPPVITSEPSSRIVAANTEIVLEVTADGPELSYQWYEGRTSYTDNPIAGATGNRLVIGGIDSGKYVWCRVSNPAGHEDTGTITLAVGLDETWKFNYLGLVNTARDPWIFHNELGWLYHWPAEGGQETNWYFAIHPKLSCWIWTNEAVGLWMYMNPTGFQPQKFDWWIYAREVSEIDWENFYFILGSDQETYFGGADAL